MLDTRLTPEQEQLRKTVEEFSRDVLFSRFEAVLAEAMKSGRRRRRATGRKAVVEAS